MKDYNTLNYKQKFYRTLWSGPIMVVLSYYVLKFIDGFFVENTMTIFIIPSVIVIMIGVIIQLVHNYSCWKKYEK